MEIGVSLKRIVMNSQNAKKSNERKEKSRDAEGEGFGVAKVVSIDSSLLHCTLFEWRLSMAINISIVLV